MVSSNQVMPAQCERVVITQLESPAGAASGMVEPGLETHNPK